MYEAQEQERLMFESDTCVAVLGRGEEFVLIDMVGQLDEQASDDAHARGFAYVGVLGLTNGVLSAKCEPHPDCASTMMHAALGFARQVADRLRPDTKGDAVQWLRSLHALSDNREAR